MVSKALAAILLYHRNEDYQVKDDKVKIIDEFTGHLMPDRSRERRLHQLIELKKRYGLRGEHETIARISYQPFLSDIRDWG